MNQLHDEKGYHEWLQHYGPVLFSAKRQISLEEAQSFVGGLVEGVPILRESWLQNEEMQIYVNEEGLLLNLDLNPVASIFAGHPLMGPAVILIGEAQWQ